MQETARHVFALKGMKRFDKLGALASVLIMNLLGAKLRPPFQQI